MGERGSHPLAAKLFGRPPQAIALGVLLLTTTAFLWAVFERSWVAEDAYITFRTIDNFVHGYGLRWNLDERVQTFTHPLWLLINVPLYKILGEINQTVTTLGLLCTFAAYLVIGGRFYRAPIVLFVGIWIPLILSRSVTLYSTSGFENSLSHLCFAFFASVFLFMKDRGPVPWGRLALAVALAMTTRLDTALIYAPPCFLLVISHWRSVKWGRLLLGTSPILGWLLFSVFYYGFPFPNTALAKINEEISSIEYYRQGLFYFLDLIERDPFGFFVIVLGLTVAGFRFGEAVRSRGSGSAARTASLGMGVLFYGLYVVSIGGGFLSSRFWSLPIFVMATVLCSEFDGFARNVRNRLDSGPLEAPMPIGLTKIRLALGGLVAIGVISAIFYVEAEKKSIHLSRQSVILAMPEAYWFIDEQGEWAPSRGARNFIGQGKRIQNLRVGVAKQIGMAGIWAGREVILIDRRALADPLLARLPTAAKNLDKIGHFLRHVPEGYPHARKTGSMEKMDARLQEYYRPLRSIISDPLFSWDRLRTIVTFNLGHYDHFRSDYLKARAEKKALRKSSGIPND